jgi:hypothetical protein
MLFIVKSKIPFEFKDLSGCVFCFVPAKKNRRVKKRTCATCSREPDNKAGEKVSSAFQFGIGTAGDDL